MREPCVCVRGTNYSAVGVIEQRIWLTQEWGIGRRGTSDSRCILKYRNYNNSLSHASTKIPGNLLYWCFRRLRRFGSSCVLPRAAADTRGQHSTLRSTGASIVFYAMRGWQKGAQERRREGGTRERGRGRKRSLGLLVVRQQELG